MKQGVIFALILFAFVSCKPKVHAPKPRGYFHIELPKERTYQQFDSTGFPYRFEYPTYGRIVTNPDFFGDKPENPFWMNIEFPSIGGKIYLSYKTISDKNSIGRLNEDFYQMTYAAHDKKADYIQDMYFNAPERNLYTALFNVAGDAASTYQFYATDSAHHYIRGSLYFETTPNADSLQPLNDFLKEDIVHILETLEWK